MSDGTAPAAIAILAILNADATVQSLCGRVTDGAIGWGDFDAGIDPLPTLCLEDIAETDGPIEGDKRVTFALAAFAAGPEADTTTGSLLTAAELAITNATLQTHGLDAGLDPTDMPWPRDKVELDGKALGFDYLVQRTMALAILITPG